MKTNEILSLDKIGSLISESESTLLKRNFKTKYPNHKSSILIDKSILQKVIDSDSNICGIKFLYGMSSMMEPSSKFIMLIPCLASTDNINPIPKITADGFFTSDGNNIELVNAWEALCNYVKFMRSHDLDLDFEDVSRYCYFGKTSLNILLSMENAEQIEYHFGYDDFTGLVNKCSKYRIVLQPRTQEKSLDVYMDHGGLPDPSPGDKPLCFLKTTVGKFNKEGDNDKLIDQFRNYRDTLIDQTGDSNPLVEMYYQTTDALVDKINRNQKSKEIYTEVYQTMMGAQGSIDKENNTSIEEFAFLNMKNLIEQHLLN